MSLFCNTTNRVVHNPAILIPLLIKKRVNPTTFVVIRVTFESSGKIAGLGNPVTFDPFLYSRSWIRLPIAYKTSPLKKKSKTRERELGNTGLTY